MKDHVAAAATYGLEQRAARAAELAARASLVLQGMVEQGARDRLRFPDPEIVAEAFGELGRALLDDPARLAAAQMDLWLEHGRLIQAQIGRLFGGTSVAVVEPDALDRRFKDAAWTDAPTFDWLKQSYLLNARWLRKLIAETPTLEPEMRSKVEFYAQQLIDALAPTNFALTNPAVLARAAETSGASLLDGLEHLLDDVERGQDTFTPAMSRSDAFEIGVDLATTPGSVVFRNDLIELIQYAPTTADVATTPLLIVPPWINKFYILDLRPENSFIRWAVAQELTVFAISWVNPGAELGRKTFADYLAEGPLAALAAIERQTGRSNVDVLGFCLGGTLTACLLAHLAAKHQAGRVRSATLLACLTDFAEPGEVGVFIDRDQIDRLEQHMEKVGYLEAGYMARVFAMLRANDLIWSFAVNNYLMGRGPAAFDLLYWNADGTRMPKMMHAFYLRELYLENRLVEPGAITLLDSKLDLGQIEQPVFFLSTRNDHIAPWKSTFAGSTRFGGRVDFVLAGSGHIAGVINPAGSSKYGYRTGGPGYADPNTWLAATTEHPGSWWPYWRNWIDGFDDGRVPARNPAGSSLRPLDAAPGRYVLVRADR